MNKQFALFSFVVLGAALMYGQATRTWVSGVGDDANPCSRTAPCKTFAGAISKTAPGGEIDALDPGGFGALTITKSISLDGGGGQVASVLVAGTNGIVVAAAANDVVIIRNLRLDGLLGGGNGNAGLSGIRFISGRDLDVENCVIFGFNNAAIDMEVNASATAHIINTITKNNGSCTPGSCGTAQGDGVFASTTSGTLKVAIDNSQIMLSSNNGVEAGANARVTINRSLISASGNVGAFSNGSSTIVSLDYTDVINGNGSAVRASAAGNTVLVSHSTITGNGGTAYDASGGGVVAAYATGAAVSTSGTNRVHDNGAQGSPTYITEN